MNFARFAVLSVIAPVAACGSKVDCLVPALRPVEASRVMESTSASCPVAVAETIVVSRPYGVVRLEWDYVSHSLFMRASNQSDETTFDIEGAGVDRNFGVAGQDPRLARLEYTHVKRFPGSAFNSPPPKPQRFTIAVRPVLATGPLSPDELEFEYYALHCVCTVYDGP